MQPVAAPLMLAVSLHARLHVTIESVGGVGGEACYRVVETRFRNLRALPCLALPCARLQRPRTPVRSLFVGEVVDLCPAHNAVPGAIRGSTVFALRAAFCEMLSAIRAVRPLHVLADAETMVWAAFCGTVVHGGSLSLASPPVSYKRMCVVVYSMKLHDGRTCQHHCRAACGRRLRCADPSSCSSWRSPEGGGRPRGCDSGWVSARPLWC